MNRPDSVGLSERTLTDLHTLCAWLDDVRHRGYAISDGENAYGLRIIGAPVRIPTVAPRRHEPYGP